MRVLLINGHEEVVKATRSLLESMGHDVLHVPFCETSIKAAADFRPDILLIDAGGNDMAEKFKREPALAKAVVVFLPEMGRDDVLRNLKSFISEE